MRVRFATPALISVLWMGCQVMSGLSGIDVAEGGQFDAAGVAGASVGGAAGSQAGASGSGGMQDSGTGGQGGEPQGGAGGSTGQGGNAQGGGGGAGNLCIDQSAVGATWPVDLVMMVDQSGSTSAPLGMSGTPTKWSALASGLTAFLAGLPADGTIGAGLQYFPKPIQPWSSFATCDTQNPACGSGFECLPLDNGAHCMKTCADASTCGGAECLSVSTPSFCSNDSCVPSAYASLEVPIASLGSNLSALTTSLAAHGPLTMSPTHVALRGALDQAASWASQHADRRAMVLFASDGMPTECLDGKTEMQALNAAKAAVAQALAATPAIKTLVVSICSSGDWPCTNAMNGVASSGGTGQAAVVTAGTEWAATLTAALNKARGNNIPCTLTLSPSDPLLVDWELGQVLLTLDGGSEMQVIRVYGAGKCDPAWGGWTYDVEPGVGTPTQILICAPTCKAMQDAATATIAWRVPCKP